VIQSHDAGTIQYTEWLILIDRVQPSLLAGVIAIAAAAYVWCLSQGGMCAHHGHCRHSSRVCCGASPDPCLRSHPGRYNIKCTVSPYTHSVCTVHLQVGEFKCTVHVLCLYGDTVHLRRVSGHIPACGCALTNVQYIYCVCMVIL
jgi:hypothetical protein